MSKYLILNHYGKLMIEVTIKHSLRHSEDYCHLYSFQIYKWSKKGKTQFQCKNNIRKNACNNYNASFASSPSLTMALNKHVSFHRRKSIILCSSDHMSNKYWSRLRMTTIINQAQRRWDINYSSYCGSPLSTMLILYMVSKFN